MSTSCSFAIFLTSGDERCRILSSSEADAPAALDGASPDVPSGLRNRLTANLSLRFAEEVCAGFRFIGGSAARAWASVAGARGW